MNLKQLLEELNKIENKELDVFLEGCDCTGEWNGKLEICSEDKTLLLKRD